MLDCRLDRRPGAPPLVDQLVRAVTARIGERRLVAGDRLPSIRQLAREHGLSTFTVADAYGRLVSMGVLASRRGSGYRVADGGGASIGDDPGAPSGGAGRGGAGAALHQWSPPALTAEWLLSDVFADRSIPIKAGCGWLPESWANLGGLQQALRSLSRTPSLPVSHYGHPYGWGGLREYLGKQLRQAGLPTDTGHVLLTQGATQALDLVTRLLLRPGDVVAVEEPAYCNLLQILKLAGLRVVGVPKTVDGLDVEALDRIASRERPKVLFVNSVLQNPTGVTLTPACAHRLLNCAHRHGLWLVEEDIYGPLAGAQAPQLAAMAAFDRLILIGGFSKTIAPSLRVGYVVADPSVITELARTKMAVGLTSSEIAERIVHRVLLEGHHARHVAMLRDRLADAHRRAESRLDALGAELFHRPRAGLFLWARLPTRAAPSRLAADALSAGVWLAPGSFFMTDDAPCAWYRFNVAHCEAPALWTFLQRSCE
ncbi:MAG: PLP-dependent aminotransferase family protein [Burkholderiaceae bacterium]